MDVSSVAKEKHRQEVEDLTYRLLVAKIDLFKKAKNLKDYREAQRLCEECQNMSNETSKEKWTAKFLDLEYHYAEVQNDQRKLDEAKTIARNVWIQGSEKEGQESEIWKRSLRLLFEILSKSKDYDDVEELLRPIYPKKKKGDWALEAGDLLCRALAEKRDFEEAQMLQAVVFSRRHEPKGPTDESTISSGIWRLSYLDSLRSVCKNQSASPDKGKINSHRKEILDDLILDTLKDIWRGKEAVKNKNMLETGYRLRTICYKREKEFGQAEAIFQEVWTNRKRHFSGNKAQIFRSGSWYAASLAALDRSVSVSCGASPSSRWENTAKNDKACKIFHEIWDSKSTISDLNVSELLWVARKLIDVNWEVGKHIEAQPALRWFLATNRGKLDDSVTNLSKALTWSERQQRIKRPNPKKKHS